MQRHLEQITPGGWRLRHGRLQLQAQRLHLREEARALHELAAHGTRAAVVRTSHAPHVAEVAQVVLARRRPAECIAGLATTAAVAAAVAASGSGGAAGFACSGPGHPAPARHAEPCGCLPINCNRTEPLLPLLLLLLLLVDLLELVHVTQ